MHVGIADEANRIIAMNKVRAYIPQLLALSANSPFWMGRQTGFQSFRSIVWKARPLSGIPEKFRSIKDFNQFLMLLSQTQALRPGRRIWWDIRPHHTCPTLEFRIADMPFNHKDTIALASLVLCLVKKALQAQRHEDLFPIIPTVIIEENRWRAARWGLRGQFIDYQRGIEIDVPDAIGKMLDALDDVATGLKAQGYLKHIRDMLNPHYLCGAERQIAAFQQRGSIEDVMQMLIHETMNGVENKI